MAAQFGNRLRKGATTTAVAAVAVAALAASQAPGVTTDSAGRQTTGTPSPDATPELDGTATGKAVVPLGAHGAREHGGNDSLDKETQR